MIRTIAHFDLDAFFCAVEEILNPDLRASPRVSRVRLVVAHDACPACRAAEGEFTKDLVPSLPVHGCSHARGCRCFYEPALVDIYP